MLPDKAIKALENYPGGYKQFIKRLSDLYGFDIKPAFLSNIKTGRAPLPPHMIESFAALLAVPVEDIVRGYTRRYHARKRSPESQATCEQPTPPRNLTDGLASTSKDW